MSDRMICYLLIFSAAGCALHKPEKSPSHSSVKVVAPLTAASPAPSSTTPYAVNIPEAGSAASTQPVMTPQEHSNAIALGNLDDNPSMLCYMGIINPRGYHIAGEAQLSNSEINEWRNQCANRLCTEENNHCSPQILPGGFFQINCPSSAIERCFRTWKQCETVFRGCVAHCQSLRAGIFLDSFYDCLENCERNRANCDESRLGYQQL